MSQTQLVEAEGLQDRRAAPRFQMEAKITATSQDNFYCGFSEDLSEGGVFIAMRPPPPVGEPVHLSVRIGAEPAVSAIGVVRWHRTDENGNPCGCGVQFAMLEQRAADLLHGMLGRSAQAPLLVE